MPGSIRTPASLKNGLASCLIEGFDSTSIKSILSRAGLTATRGGGGASTIFTTSGGGKRQPVCAQAGSVIATRPANANIKNRRISISVHIRPP